MLSSSALATYTRTLKDGTQEELLQLTPPLTRMAVCASQTLTTQSTTAMRTPVRRKTVHCLVSGWEPSFDLTTWQRGIPYIDYFLPKYQSSYLGNYTWITNEFRIFCSSVPGLQNGMGFVGLRWGEQKCTNKNRTAVARGAIEPCMYHGFPRLNGMELQLLTRYVNSRFMYL